MSLHQFLTSVISLSLSREWFSVKAPEPGCVLILTAAMFLTTQETWAQETAFDSNNIQSCLKADDRDVFVEGINEYFKNVSAENISVITTNQNDVMAVTAKWIDFVKIQEARPNAKIFSESASNRFVGFVEGRTNVIVPAKWASALINATSNNVGDSVFEVQKFLDQELFSQFDSRWHQDSLPVVFQDEYVVHLDEQVIHLPIEFNRLIESGFSRFSNLLLVEDSAMIAHYNDWGSSYSLFCFDPNNGKLKWKSAVWAQGTVSGSGVQCHYCELVSAGQYCFCFGLQNYCCYIESFDTENGDCVFRFSSDWIRRKP